MATGRRDGEVRSRDPGDASSKVFSSAEKGVRGEREADALT